MPIFPQLYAYNISQIFTYNFTHYGVAVYEILSP